MTKERRQNESFVVTIVRMSQKALIFVLAMVAVGYLGGFISILFDTALAKPLAEFSQIFIPLFQLEIGVYGLGSTLENVQKIRKEINEINETNQDSNSESSTQDDNCVG